MNMKKFAVLSIALVMVLSMMALFTTAESVNVAQGKSYTYTGKFKDQYPDTAPPSKMTDGVKAAAGQAYSNPVWVGMAGSGEGTTEDSNKKKIVTITIDLGSVVEGISAVALDAYQNTQDGISNPSAITVEYSADGKSFTKAGEATTKAGVSEFVFDWTFTASSPIKAKSIRLQVTLGGAWFFTSEIQVLTGSGPVAGNSDTTSPASTTTSSEDTTTSSSAPESTSSTSTPAASSTSTSQPAASTSTADTSAGGDKTNTGLYIGIAVAAVVIIGGAVLYFATKKK